MPNTPPKPDRNPERDKAAFDLWSLINQYVPEEKIEQFTQTMNAAMGQAGRVLDRAQMHANKELRDDKGARGKLELMVDETANAVTKAAGDVAPAGEPQFYGTDFNSSTHAKTKQPPTYQEMHDLGRAGSLTEYAGDVIDEVHTQYNLTGDEATIQLHNFADSASGRPITDRTVRGDVDVHEIYQKYTSFLDKELRTQ